MTVSQPKRRRSGARYTDAQIKLFALSELVNGSALRHALAAYEATNDHDHGRGPITPGRECPGGPGCWVSRARRVLAAIDTVNRTIDEEK